MIWDIVIGDNHSNPHDIGMKVHYIPETGKCENIAYIHMGEHVTLTDPITTSQNARALPIEEFFTEFLVHESVHVVLMQRFGDIKASVAMDNIFGESKNTFSIFEGGD